MAFAVVMGVCLTSAKAAEDLLATCKSPDVEASISACSRLLDGNPTPEMSAVAHQFRGFRLMGKNEYNDAVTDLTAALALKPKYFGLLNARGNSYIALGKLDLARTDFDGALGLKPDFAPAYAGRSTVDYLLGDMDKTISDASEAIRLDPKQYAGYNNRGSAYREKGDYASAMRDLNVAVRLSPYASRPLYNRGLTALRMSELRSSLADYEAAIVVNPKEMDAVRGRDAVRALLTARDVAPATGVVISVTPAVPAPAVPGVPMRPTAFAAIEGSRPPTIGTAWSSFVAEKLGVRFLFEKAKDPREGYSYEENDDWIDRRPHSNAVTANASHFIRVLEKPADQPIEEAIRAKFIAALPPLARANCRLRPYAPMSGADPAKPSFEIAPTGAYGKKIDERRGNGNAVGQADGGCGAYGTGEVDSYFEYHPDEDRTKYLYVLSGFDPSYDERSIRLGRAAAKQAQADAAPAYGSMPEDLASKIWNVSLNADPDGTLYCEALLNGRNEAVGGDYSIRYRVETARQGHLVVTYPGAPMQDVERISTALDGKQLGSFPAKTVMYGKENAVVAPVDAAAFKEQELDAFTKPDATFLRLSVGGRSFEVPVRGYVSVKADLDACISKLPPAH